MFTLTWNCIIMVIIIIFLVLNSGNNSSNPVFISGQAPLKKTFFSSACSLKNQQHMLFCPEPWTQIGTK